MIVKSGYAEANPEFKIYLVRFEGADRELGPPIGCLADELTQVNVDEVDVLRRGIEQGARND